VTVLAARLAAVAVRPDQYPSEDLPEFAFVGKSNVGKSSLLNCLLNRKALARTSAAPGKTRTINFYECQTQVPETRLLLVDLPGYGYAKLSRSETQKWGKMVEHYLLRRDPLKTVFMLVDIRHDPGALDQQMFDWLRHYGFDIVLVATKADKVSRAKLPGRLAALRRALGAAQEQEPILPFSSLTKSGTESLWGIIQDKISAGAKDGQT
jgi:GTP-binding protein